MSEICGTELTENDIQFEQTLSPSSPSTTSLRFQFSKIGLTRNASVEDLNPFAALRIHQVYILVVSILLVIVILQIPTILFFTNTPPPVVNSSFTSVIDFKTCSVNANTTMVPNTSQLSIMDYCSKVPPLVNQDESTYNMCLANSFTLLRWMVVINSVLSNKQCNNSAVSFFCSAMYYVCGDDDNSTVDLMEKCVEVRDNDCPIEWRGLENILDVLIPSCESYTANTNITFDKAPPLNCPDQFDEFCGSLCLPVCEEYSQVSRDAAIASDVLTLTVIIIGLIGGLITLVACIFNRDKMFKFPQIYVVYNTVTVMTMCIFYVLPLIFGRNAFLCSDSNLIEAVENPSGYCQAQGFILHTGFLYFFGFMLSHLAHLFFAIAFPFKTRRFMADHAKTTHVIEMIIILVLGSLPSIITINISGYQFSEFLPYMYVCTSRDRDVFFYTFLLPIVIGATIGLPMLFTTFWLLRRNYQLNAVRSTVEKPHTIRKVINVWCIDFSSPEKKLFILLLYYTLLLLVLLTFLTVELQTAYPISKEVRNYFSCSAAGYQPECEVSRDRIESLTWPSYYLDLTSISLLCSVTLSNLVYVLQIGDIKMFIVKLCKSKT